MALPQTVGGSDYHPGPVFSRPVPVPGCRECADMDQQWVDATTPNKPSHDPSKSTDIVVLMRRHKSEKHGVQQ